MAPTALFYPPAASVHESSSTTTLKGPALVVGSLSTAQDGKYQSVLESLGYREVERQLIDRLVDEATTLAPNKFASVHVILSHSDFDAIAPKLSILLSMLSTSLTPLGLLHVSNLAASPQNLTSELTLAGFTIVSHRDEQGSLIAQKPSFIPGASVSLKKEAVPLAAPAAIPLPRRTLSAAKSSKHALWTISSPSTPPIDPESLLTAEDRARPVACEPMTNGGPRRKKACKGCTCGLAELEEEERRTGKVVLLDGAESGETKEVVLTEKDRLAAAAKASSKATSSCGSCFLGDAFRCASCPYLGLPAFKPGEKVEIDFGMDDI